MTRPHQRGTGRRRAPGAITSCIAVTATRPLPRYVRARYRQEFLAEMYGMTRAARTRHAVQLLIRSVALRSAIRAPSGTAEATRPIATSSAPWRCRLANHRWVTHSTTDGMRFRQCARCGKDKYDGSAGPMDGFIAANPYGSGF